MEPSTKGGKAFWNNIPQYKSLIIWTEHKTLATLKTYKGIKKKIKKKKIRLFSLDIWDCFYKFFIPLQV